LARPLIRALIVVASLAAACAAGGALISRLGPAWLRSSTERFLSAALAAEVSIERASLQLGPGVSVRASGLSVWPRRNGPALSVQAADIEIDPVGLLLGHVSLRRVVLDAAALRIERTQSGVWDPPLPSQLLSSGARGPADAEGSASVAGIERLARIAERALESARRQPIPDLAIELRAGKLELIDHLQRGPDGEPLHLAIERFRIHAAPWTFGRGVTIAGSGRLLEAGIERGRFEIEARRGPDRTPRLALRVTDLDLGLLDRATRWGGPGARPTGTATGRIEVVRRDQGHSEIAIDLAVRGLTAALPGSGPLPAPGLALPELEIRLAASVARESLRVSRGEIETTGVSVRFDASAERPLRPASVARLHARLDPVEVAALKRLLMSFPGALPFDARLIERFEGGSLDALELEGSAPLERWPALLIGDGERDVDRLRLRAVLADVDLRLGGREPLRSVGGEIRFEGDRLELRRLHAVRGGAPLPRLDVTLLGVRHLVFGDPKSRGAIPEVGDLRGIGPLWRILFGPRPPGAPRGPSRVLVDADWIHHPALIWPIEQLLAVLRTEKGGFSFRLESGTWGGAPISGDGRFFRDPEPRLTIALAAGAPISRDKPWQATRYWARGEFESDGFFIGPLAIESAGGEFDAKGETLRLHEIVAACGPTLRQTGAVELDLSRPDSVPMRTNFEIGAGSVPELASALGLDPEHATGDVDVTGVMTGWLHPGHHPLSDLTGTTAFTARDGEIRRELPAARAVASVSDENQLLRGRDVIRYQEINGVFELKAGRASLEEFSIDSPDLRILVSGHVNVVDPEHPLEVVVGVFLFRTLDATLDRIPLLNKLILGRDKNLVGAYFELTGPWREPTARLIATKTLASGPGKLVMSVPSFVKKGFDAIQSVVMPEHDEDAERPEPLPHDASRGS
jgi:hypothetical protein